MLKKEKRKITMLVCAVSIALLSGIFLLFKTAAPQTIVTVYGNEIYAKELLKQTAKATINNSSALVERLLQISAEFSFDFKLSDEAKSDLAECLGTKEPIDDIINDVSNLRVILEAVLGKDSLYEFMGLFDKHEKLLTFDFIFDDKSILYTSEDFLAKPLVIKDFIDFTNIANSDAGKNLIKELKKYPELYIENLGEIKTSKLANKTLSFEDSKITGSAVNLTLTDVQLQNAFIKTLKNIKEDDALLDALLEYYNLSPDLSGLYFISYHGIDEPTEFTKKTITDFIDTLIEEIEEYTKTQDKITELHITYYLAGDSKVLAVELSANEEKITIVMPRTDAQWGFNFYNAKELAYSIVFTPSNKTDGKVDFTFLTNDSDTETFTVNYKGVELKDWYDKKIPVGNFELKIESANDKPPFNFAVDSQVKDKIIASNFTFEVKDYCKVTLFSKLSGKVSDYKDSNITLENNDKYISSKKPDIKNAYKFSFSDFKSEDIYQNKTLEDLRKTLNEKSEVWAEKMLERYPWISSLHLFSEMPEPEFPKYEFGKINTYEKGKFTDVDEDEWFGAESQGVIKNVYELGLMYGDSETAFNPNGNVSLAEVITIASRTHNATYGNGKVFEQNDIWYKPYVDYAIENRIVKDGEFKNYELPATRAQVAYIFSNSIPHNYLPIIKGEANIPDVNEEVNYYLSIQYLYVTGIIAGNDESASFYPYNNISRAEVAAIVSRIALPQNRLS